MRTRFAPLAALATSALFLAGCSAGTTDSSASPTSASGTTEPAMTQQCLPVPGDSIVVLADDMMLQNSDNLVPAVNAATVSYTHLRAHETKANLVCRLLLEKKKN